jgi:hypothetical protein
MTEPMTRKSTILFLAIVGLLLAHQWYNFTVTPTRPTDIYPPWSSLMLLIPGSLFWVIGVVGLVIVSCFRRNGKNRPLE